MPLSAGAVPIGYRARSVADSVAATTGIRLTTMELRFPRFILAEFNTHCAFSRNSASSRAVPTTKRVEEALHEPFVPSTFGRNRAGMTAGDDLSAALDDEARFIWLRARDDAVLGALRLLYGRDAVDEHSAPEILGVFEALLAGGAPRRLDVHKQVVNRLLEPFLWQTVIVTATEWSNFLALRGSTDAQPEMQIVSAQVRSVLTSSAPRTVDAGGWHLPLIQPDELMRPDDAERLARISAARCARVSYLTHDGVRDQDADVGLAQRLLQSGHMSPFEHVATAMAPLQFAAAPRIGKLRGWVPFRSTLPHESDFSAYLADHGGAPD